MDPVYGSILAFLEMTSLYAGLLILHGLRKIIGSASLYIAIGLLFVFLQIAGVTGIHISAGITGMDFNLLSTGILLPILAVFMVIYILEGTLAAQRVIFGMIAAFLCYFYLAKLITPDAFTLAGEGNAEGFGILISESLHRMAANLIAFSFDIFLIPIFYQGLRNLKCRLFFSVMGSLVLVQIIDSLVYGVICHLGEPSWWNEITNTGLFKTFATLWLSVITTYYLARIGRENPGDGRTALDLVIAFFGHYGKTQALEENLRKTEERYSLLFQNAGGPIAVISRDGILLNANRAALTLTGITQKELDESCSFPKITGLSPDLWLSTEKENTAQNILNIEKTGLGNGPIPQEHLPAKIKMPRTGRLLELSFTPFRPSGNEETEFIVFGRDVTERTRLEQEMEEWRIKTFHNQRLESIGRLAGGIAHDFNNYLYAIQGHLDIIHYMHNPQGAEIVRHLEKIDAISEKASLLTRQLLGFARKGNYMQEIFDPATLIHATLELFLPDSPETLSQTQYSGPKAPSPFRVKGDLLQIQQALLNVMINARDAMKNLPEGQRKLSIELLTPPLNDSFIPDPPREGSSFLPEEMCVIRISDSGPGVPEEVRHRIFEPFFTTKPVGEGTGMGLAMAYGAMMTLHGWLQHHNSKEGGAVFELVFPLAQGKNPR